ncbi:MAG: CapA family protein [Prevotella sp.]|nr:CapA family protein [Prevotella sp.]
MMIAGDLVVNNRSELLLQEGKYGDLLADVKSVNAAYDYRVVNLECPIVMRQAEKIEKVGPHLRCDEKVTELLRYGLFDGVTLANNHFRDFGDEGVADTLRLLDERGIDHVGGGNDIQEAACIVYKEFHGERLALINCTENEFSIATTSSGGANPLNSIRQYYAIREARTKADYVVVITHGGVEKYELPTLRMKETFRFFVDAGADAVVNHHQHCVSGYETYKGRPIFYGLGNFCFDYPQYRGNAWNKGMMVGLVLEKETVRFETFPYFQSDERPGVVLLDGQDKETFDKEIERLNAVIADDGALKDALQQFVNKSAKFYSMFLTPYTKRWSKGLYARGLLPAYFPRQKWIELLSEVRCESHRDNFIAFILEKLGKGKR